MLQAIKKWFDCKIEAGVFTKCSIGDLEKSCCTGAVTPVIDFDRVKNWLVKETSSLCLASVDGLYFGNHTIVFIEMKSWMKYIENNPHPTTNSQDEELKAIARKFRDQHHENKMRESIILFNDIAVRRDVHQATPSPNARKNFYQYPKCFVLLTDIDGLLYENPLYFISSGLELLSESSSLIKLVNSQLDLGLAELSDSITSSSDCKSIIRKSCTNIDAFLETI